MNIQNAIIIITGGASGMGAATAKYLSSQDAKIALLDLNQEAVDHYASKINAIGIACDVTKDESVKSALKQVEDQLGIPRVIINCAGIVHGRRMVNKEGSMPLEEFRRVIDVNLIGTFNVMRLAVAMMINNESLEDNERGVIINTASVAAFEGQIGQCAYSASKGGIVALTLPAARELAQFGIRVMTIAPGLVDTPMFSKIPPEARASLAESVPFPKRLADPLEFAFLAEHIIKNRMLNGEVIRLDGALRMQEK